MTDNEILDELIGQRTWWERAKEKKEKELDDIKAELSKVERLIEVLQLKMRE